MKIGSMRETLPLCGETIDLISKKTEELLLALKTEKANVLRIRLSLEEALLRFADRFGENTPVTYSVGKRLTQYYMIIELEGDTYNPLADDHAEMKNFSESLFNGLDPEYSYSRGRNTVTFRLTRRKRNPAVSLITALIAGMAVGIAGKYLLSPEIMSNVVTTVLRPVYDLFFRLLNAASGPVIFLSVAVVICGMGGVAAIGKNGRGMVLRFMYLSFLVTILSCLIAIPFFNLEYAYDMLSGTEFTSLLDAIFNVAPNDVFMPFVSGDSPQIILLAVVLGNAILIAGNKAAGLKAIVEQANGVGLKVAEWISRLTPYFVFLILILEIWLGDWRDFIGIWKPVVLFLVVSVPLLALFLTYVSVRKKVSFAKLVKKIMPSFLTALRTASVESAYGENVFCCEKKLGIASRITKHVLPMGLVVYMPAGSFSMLFFTLYAAQVYGVSVSTLWYIFAIISTVLLVVAVPPV
ncbi:MAG: cation:dicarboxylase symporter family transporter, partial [Clostridia bacterium]|nr:cation:dicarboxylase symporter family transporter [Clostridia bacterium]